MNAPDAAREYHRLTSYTAGFVTPDDPRKRVDWAGPMKEPRPPQFKTYPSADQLPLPREIPPSGAPAVDALSRDPLADGALDAVAFARILFYSAGIARFQDRDGGRLWFRQSGSAGNLCPLELYLATGAGPGLPAGLFHYDPLAHALDVLRAGDHRAPLARALAADDAAAAYVVLTGVPWRTSWKYRERGFRHIYWDAGTMLGQLLTLAGALRATAPRLYLGFVDHALRELLGADGVDEFPIAVVGLGHAPAPDEPLHGALPRGSLSPQVKRFPLVSSAQEGGALASPADVRAWREAAGHSSAFPMTPIPRASTPPTDLGLERAIRTRGSTRRFVRAPAPAALVSWGLAAAARSLDADFVPCGRTWIEHFVLVHEVDGVAPGTYRFASGELLPLRRGDVRGTAAELCCGQDLASDGAFTVFHATDVAAVTDALGSRGYRAALLEAGVVEGRLHLAAVACGLGASGLTFFDHQTKAYFGELDAMLVTAVGKPAYRPRLGGRPGKPTQLHGLVRPSIAQR